MSGKALLDYTGFTDLSAANGQFGTLLLDPYNVIISNGANNTGGSFTANTNDSIINAATLQTALGAANVAITTGTSGTQAGNITVAAPLTWSAATTLALNAAGAIAINAPITITGGGGLVLNATAQAGITTTGLTFGNGASVDYGATNNGGRFRLNGISYTLVYSMAQLDAIDGVNAVNGAALTPYGAGLTGAYALATNLNATGTTYTQALIGTNSSGTTTTEFRGLFDGLGHTITGLTINAPSTDYIGLIGYSLNGSISNVGLVGGSVIGGDNVGALIGDKDAGVVQTSFATTAVTGTMRTGGLIGTVEKEALLQSSYATGAVTGGSRTGGLVGEVNFGGMLQNDYAAGAVAGSDTTGGLVGYYSQSTVAGVIETSYSSGMVTGGNLTGGLIGMTLASSGATTSMLIGISRPPELRPATAVLGSALHRYKRVCPPGSALRLGHRSRTLSAERSSAAPGGGDQPARRTACGPGFHFRARKRQLRQHAGKHDPNSGQFRVHRRSADGGT